MINEKKCPCGSNKDFVNCCEPILNNHSKAYTAEQLMRSRYCAYTLKNTNYLLKSWSNETRPDELDLDSDPIKWVGLEIEQSEKGSAEDSDGTVTFTASFLSSGHLCKIHERSSFIKHENLWYYLNGKSQSSTTKVGRNESCPCGSGRKYKKCCSR